MILFMYSFEKKSLIRFLINALVILEFQIEILTSFFDSYLVYRI